MCLDIRRKLWYLSVVLVLSRALLLVKKRLPQENGRFTEECKQNCLKRTSENVLRSLHVCSLFTAQGRCALISRGVR